LYNAEFLEGYNEKVYFYEFVKTFKLDDPSSGMRFYRTELLMWHDVLHFTGTIDGLLYNEKDDSYIIIDWKRLKGGLKSNYNSPYARKRRQGCDIDEFSKFTNNKANNYGCQLTFYKKVFEYMTGNRVSAMYLVVVDSTKVGEKNALKIYDVPLTLYDEAIRQVFENRARQMLAQCEKTLHDEHMDKLIEFLDEGDAIREQKEQEEMSNSESDSDGGEKKKQKT
jgi:hypothetical protein